MARNNNDYVTKAEFVEFKEEMMNAVRTAIAEAFASQKSRGSKAPNEGKKPQISEAEKQAKKAEREAAKLAYKQDKRARNCLTSKENKLVAAQMRKEGKDPNNKRQWEAAKRAYIKANPLG